MYNFIGFIITITELKTTIENWVLKQFELKIDFDIEDALRDLSDIGVLR